MQQIPIIDITLLKEEKSKSILAKQIKDACVSHGFFYIKNHGISEALQNGLEQISKQFFNLSEAEKLAIEMKKGGLAWRGFFPVLGELTSGHPDLKEGLYFGEELNETNEKVKAQTPMHGANLFPNEVPEMKAIVLNYLNEMQNLAQQIMEAIALSLNLKQNYFYKNYTQNPLQLFRIFHYPPSNATLQKTAPWGVGEHTDYGLITILKQDKVGGLQVKSNNVWIDAPPIENTFVCNIGDMLDYLTNGHYVSTPHRVLNTSGKERYSFPYFFDPNFDSKITKIELINKKSNQAIQRWDNENLHFFKGTYGDYILKKVGKVFPNLL